ncbi:MAG TPA: hypothetical protein VMA37_01530 [Acetobacteraceae bacterium]|nr:hypothetical protein [Acetobacteraceae bacterium]
MKAEEEAFQAALDEVSFAMGKLFATMLSWKNAIKVSMQHKVAARFFEIATSPSINDNNSQQNKRERSYHQSPAPIHRGPVSGPPQNWKSRPSLRLVTSVSSSRRRRKPTSNSKLELAD